MTIHQLLLIATCCVVPVVGGAQTFDDRVDLAESEAFQRRLMSAVTTVALDVMAGEPDPDPDRDGLRRGLAHEVLRDARAAAQRFALPVATDETLDAESTDAELQARVEAIWDALAGVRPGATDPEAHVEDGCR